MSTLPEQISRELKEIFEADQNDRKLWRSGSIDAEDIKTKDEIRLKRIEELYLGGQLKTAEDLMNAAMIYQHGDKPEHYKKAMELAISASKLGHPNGKKFSALAEDRYLLSIGKAQIWGTQYIKPTSDQPWILKEPFDRNAKTDEERKKAGLPSLDEGLRKMNSNLL